MSSQKWNLLFKPSLNNLRGHPLRRILFCRFFYCYATLLDPTNDPSGMLQFNIFKIPYLKINSVVHLSVTILHLGSAQNIVMKIKTSTLRLWKNKTLRSTLNNNKKIYLPQNFKHVILRRWNELKEVRKHNIRVKKFFSLI